MSSSQHSTAKRPTVDSGVLAPDHWRNAPLPDYDALRIAAQQWHDIAQAWAAAHGTLPPVTPVPLIPGIATADEAFPVSGASRDIAPKQPACWEPVDAAAPDTPIHARALPWKDRSKLPSLQRLLKELDYAEHIQRPIGLGLIVHGDVGAVALDIDQKCWPDDDAMAADVEQLLAAALAADCYLENSPGGGFHLIGVRPADAPPLGGQFALAASTIERCGDIKGGNASGFLAIAPTHRAGKDQPYSAATTPRLVAMPADLADWGVLPIATTRSSNGNAQAPRTPRVRSSSSSSDWLSSSGDSPCPICGRAARSGLCSIHPDGGSVWCGHGQEHSPPTHLQCGESIVRAGSDWAFVRAADQGQMGIRSLFVRIRHPEPPEDADTAAPFALEPLLKGRSSTNGNGNGCGMSSATDAVTGTQDTTAAAQGGNGDTYEALVVDIYNLPLVQQDQPGQFADAKRALFDRAAQLIHAAAPEDRAALQGDIKREFCSTHGADVTPSIFNDSIKPRLASLKRQAAAARAAQRRAEWEAQQAHSDAPFRILGWDYARKTIHYQLAANGHLGAINAPSGRGSSGLLALAPIDFWEASFPKNERGGVDWEAAASSFIQHANCRPVFRPENLRGRGVWLDQGRVVWHLGDRLVVDGDIVPLAAMQSQSTYILKQPLHIDPRGDVLSDQQGEGILDALRSIGWQEPCAAELLAGWTVCASVGGALAHRPGLGVTASWGRGKTTAMERGVVPLLGGTTKLLSHISEAAIRQKTKGDALPVLIDESEQGDAGGRLREGHLKLLRASYDGREGGRGTTHGDNLEQLIRFSVALVGINATFPDGAEKSRTALLTRRHLPREEWQVAERKLAAAVTEDIGQALIRRTVKHFHTLQANIRTFASIIEADGESARCADAFGALLAGCYTMLCTVPASEKDARLWLGTIGWEGAQGQSEDDLDEGVQCLEFLLAHRVRWADKDHASGEITLRELIEAVRYSNPTINSSEAAQVLGRHGIKAEVGGERWDGLVVSNTAPGLQQVFRDGRWAKGGHALHFRQLPGAEGTAQTTRFLGGGSTRGVVIPWATVFRD